MTDTATAVAASATPVPGVDQVADLGAGRGPRWLDEMLRADLAEFIDLRRRVHAHPELGHRESATTALIMRTLEADGIKAELIPTGTGVIAEVGTGEQVVGLRADIDALPIAEATRLPYASTLPQVVACLRARRAPDRAARRRPGAVQGR